MFLIFDEIILRTKSHSVPLKVLNFVCNFHFMQLSPSHCLCRSSPKPKTCPCHQNQGWAMCKIDNRSPRKPYQSFTYVTVYYER